MGNTTNQQDIYLTEEDFLANLDNQAVFGDLKVDARATDAGDIVTRPGEVWGNNGDDVWIRLVGRGLPSRKSVSTASTSLTAINGGTPLVTVAQGEMHRVEASFWGVYSLAGNDPDETAQEAVVANVYGRSGGTFQVIGESTSGIVISGALLAGTTFSISVDGAGNVDANVTSGTVDISQWQVLFTTRPFGP